MLRIICAGMFALAALARDAPTSEESTQAAREKIALVIGLRIKQGSDPKADASKAIRSGQFGLIEVRSFLGGAGPPPGLGCRTPYKQAPSILASFTIGDVIDERVMRLERYATSYNQAIVSDPRYPDGDLCHLSSPDDANGNWDIYPFDVPTKSPSRAPRTLHEAARWGSAAEVRGFITEQQINSFDSFGLTPLSWAVARNNLPAIDVLLSEKADPWLSKPDHYGAVFWAAVFGKPILFSRLSAIPGRPFDSWPSRYIAGAVRGGDKSILRSLPRGRPCRSPTCA